MIIKARQLSKAFNNKTVLHEIDFNLEVNQSYVIIGGSGTGKSVFFKCILGLIIPDKGDIYIQGVHIKTATQRREAMKEIGVLFQGSALFDSLTIWENIAFGLIHGKKMDRQKAKDIAMEKLQDVKLEASVASLYPAELSGGMQRRVALARAIATHPKVIFFDEPTTGLDPVVSSSINELISECVRGIGASAITITHDMNCLKHVADKISLLKDGVFAWTGAVKDFKTTDHAYIKSFRESTSLA